MVQEFDVGDEGLGEVEESAPAAPAQQQAAPRRRPPRARTTRQNYDPNGPAADLPPAPSSDEPVEPDANYVCRDPPILWTALKRQLDERKFPLSQVAVQFYVVWQNGTTCERRPVFPTLTGDQIAGDEATSPADAVFKVGMQTFHRNAPPTKYRARFYNKQTGIMWRESEDWFLEAWVAIEARMQGAAAPYQPQQVPGQPPQYAPPGQPQYVGGPVHHHYPPPQSGDDARARERTDMERIADLRAEAARLEATLAARGQAVPQVGQPSLKDKLEELRMVRDLFGSQQPQITAADVAKIVAEAVAVAVPQQVVRLQDAGVIPKPGQVAPAVPPPGQRAFASEEEALEALLKRKENEEKLVGRFKRSYNLRSPEEVEVRAEVENIRQPIQSTVIPGSQVMGEPLRWLPLPDDENELSWRTWLGRMVAENPKRAGDILAKLTRAISDSGLLQKLMSSFQGMGGEAGEAAAAVARMNGMS